MLIHGQLEKAQLECLDDDDPSPGVQGQVYLDRMAVGGTYVVPKVHDGTRWLRLLTSAKTLKLQTTTTYTITIYDDVILADGTSNAITLTLPSAATAYRKVYEIRRTDMTLANVVTVQTGGENIITSEASATSTTLNTKGEYILLYSDGTDWRVLKRHIPYFATTFTPTGSWSTAVTYTGQWRRVGNCVELEIKMAVTGGVGTPGALTINMPTGMTIDSSAMIDAEAGISAIAGTVSIRDSGTDNYNGMIRYSSTSAIAIFADDGDKTNSQVTQANPITFASGDKVVIYAAKIPISGWKAA